MTIWQRREDWVGSQVEDRFVMINLDSGVYIALNETATEAWNLLADPRDEDAIVDALAGKFAVDRATCRQSVAALLQQMAANQLVQEQDQGK